MQETSMKSVQEFDDVPSFADDAETFAEANRFLGLDGDKIFIEKLLNKPIKFLAFTVRESHYQRYGKEVLMVQVEVDGEKRVFFTQSARIRRTLELFQDKLPRVGTIKKENRAWRIV